MEQTKRPLPESHETFGEGSALQCMKNPNERTSGKTNRLNLVSELNANPLDACGSGDHVISWAPVKSLGTHSVKIEDHPLRMYLELSGAKCGSSRRGSEQGLKLGPMP